MGKKRRRDHRGHKGTGGGEGAGWKDRPRGSAPVILGSRFFPALSSNGGKAQKETRKTAGHGGIFEDGGKKKTGMRPEDSLKKRNERRKNEEAKKKKKEDPVGFR